MKVLVTGGFGFVGKHVVEKLKIHNYNVYPMSRKNGLDLLNFKKVKSCIGDLRPDAIINCAAHVGSLHYVSTYAADVIHDNVLMAANLYKAVEAINCKIRIVNPLSNCSYPGDTQIQVEDDWLKGAVHSSVFSYGNSKRMIFVLSQCYKQQYSIKSINWLIPNTFGPGDHTDPNKVHALNGMIIRMLKAHKKNEEVFEVWGTGKPIREWAYIDDIVNFLIDGLKIETDLTYPINLAQNKGYSIKDTAKIISDAIGYKGKIVFNTKYQDGASKKLLSDKKFREHFPNYKFKNHKNGVEETVKYYESVL